MLRCQFGAIQHDSGIVPGSLTPADYDLKINSNIIGSGHQFCDHLVRYPLILSLNEILPKDKKQKEDKIISHATFTMDLAAFLSGLHFCARFSRHFMFSLQLYFQEKKF